MKRDEESFPSPDGGFDESTVYMNEQNTKETPSSLRSQHSCEGDLPSARSNGF